MIKVTQEHRTIHIPTREEFHKEYAGEITLADFSTEHPNPYRINKLASAQIFNLRNKQVYRNRRRQLHNAK